MQPVELIVGSFAIAAVGGCSDETISVILSVFVYVLQKGSSSRAGCAADARERMGEVRWW
jgi:hypothetical protein